jgi:diamine N-acetyltransferase
LEDVRIETGGAELLDTIGPLWERLRDHHIATSRYFAAETASHSFSTRRLELERKAASGKLLIDLARSADATVGYCVSSVNADRKGEVESIYLDPGFRNRGIGAAFMSAAMKWMDDTGATSRIIGVGVGNERALPFYGRFGFLPRMVMLARQKAAESWERTAKGGELRDFSVITGGIELLDTITPMWRRLHKHHAEVSTHFADFFANFPFEGRRRAFEKKALAGPFRLDVAKDTPSGALIGYCISSISPEGVGEVESLFVEKAYRRRGVASVFMNSAMAWMDAHAASSRTIGVAYGNDRALPFYAKFGVLPRVMTLVRKGG